MNRKMKKMLMEFGVIRSKAKADQVTDECLSNFCEKVRAIKDDKDFFNFLDAIRRAGELNIAPKFYGTQNETIVETAKGFFLIQSPDMADDYDELDFDDGIPDGFEQIPEHLL